MVEFFPDLNFIKKTLRPQPTEGENWLLDFLNDYLGKLNGKFEVFFQGNVAGSFPDVVILRKGHGVLIIEVKDWNLDIYSPTKEQDTWLCNKPRDSHEPQAIKSPIAQASYYKDLFYNTYSLTLAEKFLRDRKFYSVVNSAVFFYKATQEQIKTSFGSILDEKSKEILSSNGIFLFTKDSLKEDGFEKIPYSGYFLRSTYSKFFTDDIYDDFRRNLCPSEHSLIKHIPKYLNDKQKKLAISVPNKKQKIKGVAGCGKTLVMAYRAVDAYKKTKQPVVILTFNITLCNYIRDVISNLFGDIPQKSSIMRNYFIIKHYHNFVRNYNNENNQFDEKKFDEKKNKYVDTFRLKEIPQPYQTILVDEAQDYEKEWIDDIHNLLEPGGELVFFGDEEQNLYQREQIKDADDDGKKGKRIYTGLGGQWNKLDKTYRLSEKIADFAGKFQKYFLTEYDSDIIERAEQLELVFGERQESTIDYFYTNFSVDEVLEIFKSIVAEYKIHDDDICILSEKIEPLREIDYALRQGKFLDKKIETTRTFASLEDFEFAKKAAEKIWDEKPATGKIQIPENTSKEKTKSAWLQKMIKDKLYNIQRSAKFKFRMESGKVKLSTIHSYKGWGINTEILILFSNDDKFLNDEMVYTGITRAREHLIIINCGNERYDKFFKQNL